jgi:hypothetical protein
VADNEDPDQIVTIIPGGGWMIWDGRRGWSTPVVAWALRRDGSVVAMESDSAGLVWPLDPTDGHDEIWHPEASSRHSQERLQHHRSEIDAGGS